jgi:Mg/Co/Ni transporter MgtE
VETVVEKQQSVELENFMAKLAVADIVEILETLSAEEAALLWPRVPAGRSTDVLWEVSDELRDQLEEVAGGVDFNQLRRENLDKDASRLDEIRRENLEKD